MNERYDLDAELAAHAALGGKVITPRFGTTDAERAELRAAGFILSDDDRYCPNCGSGNHTLCNR
jgi:hypothetical protein